MLKQGLITGTALVGLLLSNAPAQAQAQQPPQNPAPQRQVVESDVSSQELQQFASAVQELQVIERDTRQKMVQAVEEEGLTEERFVEILQSQRMPDAEASSNVDQTELQQFEQAQVKLGEIQQQSQSQMLQAVEGKGLEVQRFNQIVAMIQRDPSLQQQVQELLQN